MGATIGIISWVLIILWILFGILQIVMIVKFFQIAKDVSILKNKAVSQASLDFKKEFYKWIVAGDRDKAKEALFNAISLTPAFINALQPSVNDSYRQKLQDSLNKEFAKELTMLGIENIDLFAIK
ncbi:hypothetical protein [Parabacteroides pacaensis]|uniref:hypothetical protein n=1 Tax=Parabacteroides pacaensis TaxID=2086575 RepID=UPI000D0F699D|nr:hypothetical protein [Parabacteroides pacaensis]